MITKISKDQFLKVYNEHLPNKWTKLSFRYFSVNTDPKDKWVKRTFNIILSIIFALGYFGKLVNASKTYMLIMIFTLIALLISIGIFMGAAAIMNNIRIKKIRNILGISKEEYNAFKELYL